MIQNGEYPNCTTMAKEFEMSVRTLKRNIDFMKTRLNLPIGFDATINHFITGGVIKWHAPYGTVAWYSRYFRLSKEEFEGYPGNQAEMDSLAHSCAGAAGIGNNRERFIYSEKPGEDR